MANYNVNLTFTADTKAAKAQLQSLKNELQNLSTGANLDVRSDTMSKQLNEASQAARELKAHLEAATNVQTGNLDFTKLNRSLKESGKTLSDYGKQLKVLGADGEQAFVQLTRSVMNAEVPIRKTSDLFDKMLVTFKNNARWMASSAVLNGITQSLSSAYSYAQNLNKSLNDIRIVTGYNIDQMADFADEANKAAKALSTSTTSYTKASLIYYQMGLSDKEVKERADVTVKLANATGQSTETISEQLTSVWNNFYDGSKSLEYYADVMTKLGAATASSSDEIAEGLNKFAAVADTVGLSYEYAASALATVTATTRESADVVGNSFKTLFSRIQGLNLGETQDDGTTLNKYSQALASVGVNIKDTSGNLKNMDAILDDLGAKWETLSKNQQVALAQTVGGVRQYANFIAIMDNWSYFQENLGVALGSTGALQEQADIYAESWEAAQMRVKASAQAIYSDLLDDEFFIKMLNTLDKILEGADKLINSLGGVKGVLSSISLIVLSLGKNSITQGLNTMFYNASMMTQKGRDRILADKKQQVSEAIGNLKVSGFGNKAETERLRQNFLHEAELQNQAQVVSATATDSSMQVIKSNLQTIQELGQQSQDAVRASTVHQSQVQGYLKKTIGFRDLSGEARTNVQKHITDYQDALLQSNLLYSDSGHAWTVLKDYGGNKIDAFNEMAQGSGLDDAYANELRTALGQSYEAFEAKLQELDEKALQKYRESHDKIVADIKEHQGNKAGAKIAEFENFESENAVSDADLNPVRMQGSYLNAVNQTGKAIGEAAIKQKEWSDIIVETSTLMFGLTSALNTISSIGDVIKDEDLSGWEKFTSILTSLSFTLPLLISSGKSLKSVISKETLARIANTAAAGAEATALKKVNAQKSIEKGLDKVDEVGAAVGKFVSDLKTSEGRGRTKSSIGNKWASFKDSVSSTWNEHAQKGFSPDKQKEYFEKAREKYLLEGSGFDGLHHDEQTSYIRQARGKFSYNKKKMSLDEWFDSQTPDAQARLVNNKNKAALDNGYKEYVADFNKQEKAFYRSKGEELFIDEQASSNATSMMGKDAAKSLGGKIGGTMLIAAGVAVAVASIKAMKNEYDKANIAAEKAAANAKTLASAYESAKTSYNNLKTSIDSWNEKDTALNSLQKNTLEWKEALVEANDAALELINTYDDLSYTVDENGRIQITEDSLEAAKEKELLEMQAAQGRAAGAKAEAFAAENEANRIEFNRKYSNKDTLASVNQSLVYGAAGAGAGLASGALIGAGIGLLLGPVGVALGAGIGAAIGAGVGGEVGRQVGLFSGVESEEEKAIVEDLVDSYDKLGSGLYATAEFTNAVNDLGLTTEEEISALKDLIKSTNANTSALEAQLKVEGKASLDVWTDKQEDSAYAKAYSKLTEAEKGNLGKRVWESGALAEYKDKLLASGGTYGTGGKSDKEVGLEYAEKILGWDKSVISYKAGNGEGHLTNTETQQELTVEDDKMRTALAKWHAEQEAVISSAEAAAIADIPKIRQAGYDIAIKNSGDKSSMHALGNLMTSEDLSSSINEIGVDELRWLVDAYNDGTLSAALSGLDFSATKYGTMDNFLYQFGNVINEYDEAGAAANEAKRRQKEYEEALSAGTTELEVSEAALKHYASTLAEANQYLKDGTGYVAEYATAQARLRVGLTAVAKAIQDNADKLGNSSKGTLEYSKAVSEVATAMNKLFSTTSITGKFVEDNYAEILNFVKTGEGVGELQKLIAEEYLTSQTDITDTALLDQVREAMKWLQAKNLEAGQAIYLNDTIFNKENLDGALAENKKLGDILNTLGSIYGYTFGIGTEIESVSRDLVDADFVKAAQEVAEELEEVLDIYHEIERAVKSVSNVYDRISKARDRAFGAGKLAGYQDEMDQLDLLIQKTEEYQAIAEKELNEQANKLYQDTNGAVQFDKETGEILNWYELASLYGSKFAEEYEAALDTWRTQTVAAADYAADKIDKMFEKINYKIDLQLDFSKEDQKYLDFLIAQNNDPLKDAAENIGRYNEKVQSMISSLSAYGEGLSEAFNGNIITDLNNIQGVNVLLEQIAEKGLTENEVELLEKYRDSLYEVGEALNDYVDTIKDYVIAAFEEMNAQFEDTTSKLEHWNTLLESYKNIIDLTGRDVLGMTDEAYISLLQAQQNNANAQVAANKEIYEANKQALEKLQNEYNDSWSEEAKEAWQEAIQTAEEQVRESEENLMSSWQEALETAASVFESTINAVVDTFEKSMTGVYGTFEKLQEAYDQQSTLNSRYVADYEKIYTLSKLNRNIQKSIDDTSNLKGKKALRELQQEINELNESDAEISKYQLDYLQKQYDLRLTQIALEEAQNAKSQVRLKRDSEGNYAYVFTANADEVSKAEQSYEDALYSAQKLTQEYISENEAAIVQIQKEYADAMRNIRAEDYASQEEYQQALKETAEYYQQMMEYRTGELSLAIGNAKDLYNNEWLDYSEKTGYKISKNKEWVDSFDELNPALKNKYDSLQELTQAWNEATVELTNGVSQAYDAYKQSVTQAFEAAGTSIEDFATDYGNKVNDIEKDTEALMGNFDSLASKVSSVFAGVVESASTNYTLFSNKIAEYQTAIANLIKKLDEALEKAAEVEAIDVDDQEQTPDVDLKPLGGGDDESGNTTPSSLFTGGSYTVSGTGPNEMDSTPKTISGDLLTKILQEGKANATGTQIYYKAPGESAGIYYDVDALRDAIQKANDFHAGSSGYQGLANRGNELLDALVASASGIASDKDKVDVKKSTVSFKNGALTEVDRGGLGKQYYLQRYYWDDNKMKYDDGTYLTEDEFQASYPASSIKTYKGKQYIYVAGLWSGTAGKDKYSGGWYPVEYFQGFRTGGYTGDWTGTEGRLALLHQKEIVLNKEDTSNLLSTVDMVRNIAKIIDLNAASSANALGILTASASNNQGQVVEQHVEITASFPNATNHSEIEQAFTTLINQASQFANRKKI